MFDNMAELNDRELLIQIGTKLEGLSEVVRETRQNVVDLDRRMEASVTELNKKVGAMEDRMSERFITKEEFEPVKKIVYGLAGLLLTALILAMIGQVFVQP